MAKATASTWILLRKLAKKSRENHNVSCICDVHPLNLLKNGGGFYRRTTVSTQRRLQQTPPVWLLHHRLIAQMYAGACYSHTCWIFFLQPFVLFFWYITISFIFFLLALTSEQLFESIASPIHAFTHTRAHVHAHTWTCKLISQTSPCKLISPTPAYPPLPYSFTTPIGTYDILKATTEKVVCGT